MAIRILITGGTFDKDYDEISARLYFKDTHIHEMLRLGRCRLRVSRGRVHAGGWRVHEWKL